jgi:dTDP-4-amino-4,6-dideoxygalactose transaminase
VSGVVAFNDFCAEPEALLQAELAAAERVLRSGRFVLGAEVAAFEREWAERCGVRFCIGVGNGMDAIEIGLRALGIGPGDEVITTGMTAFATVLAVLRAGAVPVLADVDAETALLDAESVRRCITPRTRAVLPVHLYGRMCDVERIQHLCVEHSLQLIEDCAQSHDARVGGRSCGAFGTVGAFSFYPTKNLGAIGDAGALITDDAAVAQRAVQLRNYGQSERYVHVEHGSNSRLDELQAALLRARLPWLAAFTEQRRRCAKRLREGIVNPAVRSLPAPAESDVEQHVWHLFVVRCERRDALAQHLARCGVAALAHYPIPVHRQAPCVDLPRDPHGLLHTEAHAAQCLSLPSHPQLSDADLQRVIDAVNAFEK